MLNQDGQRRSAQLKAQISSALDKLLPNDKDEYYRLANLVEAYTEPQLQFLKKKCSSEIYACALELLAINWMLRSRH